MQYLKIHLIKEISKQAIYERFGSFEKSSVTKITDASLNKLRLVLILLVLASYGLLISAAKGSTLVNFLGRLEYYTCHFTLFAYLAAMRAAYNPALHRKKRALILTELAFSISSSELLLYFVIKPVIFGSQFTQIMNASTMFGILIPFLTHLINFACVDFAFLE